ncbi:MAG: hypothetical protein CBE43_09150 [Rhodopirellula sp. TMED283]|nr:MAG: hypothetical protein CBE43_09150 [Rhodopirellula sp. TMED283]
MKLLPVMMKEESRDEKVSETKQVRMKPVAGWIYHCHQGRLQFIIETSRWLILTDFRLNRVVMPAHKLPS